MNLIDYIAVYEDVLDDELCKNIITAFNMAPEYITQYKNDVYDFNQLEMNTVPSFAPTIRGIYTHLAKYYEDYFSRLGLLEFVDINAMEALRIKHYKKGTDQQFRTHVDVGDYESARRYAIAIIYLNDNDGGTVFPQLEVEVKPKRGRMVMFPPTWMFPHAGLPPTDNDKYIMMTSLHYS